VADDVTLSVVDAAVVVAVAAPPDPAEPPAEGSSIRLG
jgi:hypothetical protein